MSNRIENILKSTMENIRASIDANNIVGKPIAVDEDNTIIPISKVSFGFVTGGGEYSETNPKSQTDAYPYAGGSGAGVSIKPIGFLVCGARTTFIKIDEELAKDKWLDLAKSVLNFIKKQ